MGSDSSIYDEPSKVEQTEDVTGERVELGLTESTRCYYLAKFKLYETRSYFYMVGRDKSKKFWRVLKIDRLELSELVLCEDPTVYSYSECCALLRRIHEGNKQTGGLKIVTSCYGIVGFIRFLGPYYMIIITERKKVGMLCGHAIYGVAKSKMIPIPHSTVRSNLENSKNENRYKKLLGTLDITKDFYFSYSYCIMHSLQNNLRDDEPKYVPYETMFVWNAFLTRGVRSHLGNTLWTVALIQGFFKQIKFLKCERTVSVTLIARRSRHFAGTRYLKRGINEKGRAANDVETEQIVFEEDSRGRVSEISSVVQIRGSIPLLWSQETSRLSIKPDIILREDPNYEATRKHFKNLVDRYGSPVVILNLIKTKEKRPRESILHAEFVKAVSTINRGLDKDNRLKFRTVDLTRLFRLKGAKVLTLLSNVAGNALNQTGFFHCPLAPFMDSEMSLSLSHITTELEDINEKPSRLETLRLQSGVLRTNCIDCLDRTNVAQYSYGLVALGHQLHAIGIIPTHQIDLDDSVALNLMGLYEAMGDTLALQYGGSGAHNKIFSERKGHWKAATQSQEFIRTLQRYLSNAYLDSEKQDAINLFLGHFQPEVGKPTLWELDSDQHFNIGRITPSFNDINRSFLKRSLSDGVLVYEISLPSTPADIRDTSNFHQTLPELKENKTGLSESTPEISTTEASVSSSRYTPSLPALQIFTDTPEIRYVRGECSCYSEHGDEFDCTDIFDIDWVSSSANSCEEETYDSSSLLNSPAGGSLYGSIVYENASEGKTRTTSPLLAKYPDSFVNWVEYGSTLA